MGSRMTLEAIDISKRFRGVQALSGISITLQPGEIHAVCGENGAGKSTLGKILAGLYEPDEGEIRIDGKIARFHSPADAQAAGIHIVHQELLFAENLSVADNLRLGDLPHRFGIVDDAACQESSRAWLATVGSDVEPSVSVASLPVSKQQLVQIAGGLGRGAKVLILDEPTSALTNAEADRLLSLVADLARAGTTFVYVSHRLDEIFRIADRVTVLRDGKFVDTFKTTDLTEAALVTAMVGRELSADRLPSTAQETVRLRVRNFASPGRFHGVSFEVRAGEIVGLAGLVGAGRTEVLEGIFGLDGATTGEIVVDDRPVQVNDVKASITAGIGLIPEDRKRHGLVLGLSVRHNATLGVLTKLSKLGWIHRAAEQDVVQAYIRRLQIRTPGADTEVGNLSGGNQQKVVLAKWLATDANVLLIDEPTRGVDVGAKEEIYSLLREAAMNGAALCVASSEMNELRALCDRILVMRNGTIVAELPGTAPEDAILGAMAGVSAV
jgi:ABC-type sugar transport system ATPase subunit